MKDEKSLNNLFKIIHFSLLILHSLTFSPLRGEKNFDRGNKNT